MNCIQTDTPGVIDSDFTLRIIIEDSPEYKNGRLADDVDYFRFAMGIKYY